MERLSSLKVGVELSQRDDNFNGEAFIFPIPSDLRLLTQLRLQSKMHLLQVKFSYRVKICILVVVKHFGWLMASPIICIMTGMSS